MNQKSDFLYIRCYPCKGFRGWIETVYRAANLLDQGEIERSIFTDSERIYN